MVGPHGRRRQRADRGHRRRQSAERVRDRADLLGPRVQAQGRPGHEAERPLGADEQRAEVHGGSAEVDAVAPRLHGRPVLHHDLEVEQEVPRAPVLHRPDADAAGVDPAADRGAEREHRVHGEEEARGPRAVVRLLPRAPRLDDHRPRDGIDLDDAVHPAEVDEDATAVRDRAPVHPGAAAAGHEREAALRLEPHDPDHLLRRPREDDEVRLEPERQGRGLRHRREIVAVHERLEGAAAHPVGPEDVHETAIRIVESVRHRPSPAGQARAV